MPNLIKTRTRPSAGNAVRTEVHHLLHRLSTWHMRRQASRALHGLSDANLKDIGLHRSEVDSRLIDVQPYRPRRRSSA